MKIGIAIAAYDTQFGPIVLREGALEEKLSVASKLGYNGADLFGNFTEAEQALECKRLFEKYNVEIQMYAAIFLAEQNVNFTDSDKEKRRSDIRKYKEQMRLASLMGAKLMPIGFLRGGIGQGQSKEEYAEILAESLIDIAGYGKECEVVPCLEPINRYEINSFNSAIETVEFLEKYNLSQTGLLLDCFHMNIEDGDIRDTIRRCGNYVRHVHIPDSNRRACGTGHLDFNAIIRALKDIGYDGYLTVEAFPEPDAYTCAEKSAICLKQAISEANQA